MSRPAIYFLLGIAPLLAIGLTLLGIATLPANPLGWFLAVVGGVYALGLLIAYVVRRQRFWESSLAGKGGLEERGDRSFWWITAGLLAAFYLPPLEYLYFSTGLPRTGWLSGIGLGLVILGAMLFGWARRVLGKNYSGHVSVGPEQTLVQSGPYRFIRHPAYAGYLCMAFGVSLGYSSLAGLAVTLLLVVPGLVYRIRLEENLLSAHFGEQFRQYAASTARLFPGIW